VLLLFLHRRHLMLSLNRSFENFPFLEKVTLELLKRAVIAAVLSVSSHDVYCGGTVCFKCNALSDIVLPLLPSHQSLYCLSARRLLGNPALLPVQSSYARTFSYTTTPLSYYVNHTHCSIHCL
jgi:hypothetical protein